MSCLGDDSTSGMEWNDGTTKNAHVHRIRWIVASTIGQFLALFLCAMGALFGWGWSLAGCIVLCLTMLLMLDISYHWEQLERLATQFEADALLNKGSWEEWRETACNFEKKLSDQQGHDAVRCSVMLEDLQRLEELVGEMRIHYDRGNKLGSKAT